jgi:hypothetical protein
MSTFKVIYENHDNIDDKYFFQQKKKSIEEQYKHIVDVVGRCGIKEFKKCDLGDVPLNPNKKFNYFIHHVQTSNYLQHSLPLTDEFIEVMRSNSNLNVIFLNEREMEEKTILEWLNNQVNLLGLNPKQFYFVNNNGKLSEYKKQIGTDINVHSIRYLALDMMGRLEPYNVDFNTEKEFMFVAHNRRMKHHRYIVLSMLKYFNINNVDWSIIEGENYRTYCTIDGKIDTFEYGKMLTQTNLDSLMETINYYLSIDTKKSKYEEEFEREQIDWVTIKPETYSNSYINITTESNFETDDIHITEKSFKPFYFYQIPIFFSTHNHLKVLNERYDFDMFDDLIDHSYDSEPNHQLRMLGAFNEVIKINNDPQKVINFYKNNQERFIDNKKKVINILNDKTDYNFFNGLI